jgi:hypothetical protein
MLRGPILFYQTLDPFVCRLIEQRRRTSPLAIIEGCLPFPHETLNDRINGGTGAEKHPSDVGRVVAI